MTVEKALEVLKENGFEDAEATKVQKANGEADGIRVPFKDSPNKAVIIYPERFSDEDELLKAVNEYQKESEVVDKIDKFAEDMKDYELIKDRLYRIVLNISNKDRYAMIPINDSLGYAFKIFINDEMSVTVTPQHVGVWGIDVDKMYVDSKVKETVIKPLSKVVNELAPEEMKFMFPVDENDPILLVSNVNNQYGAVNIFETEVMQQIHDRLGNDFAVLPSSVHEVLCADITEMQDDFVETAKSMVQEVNSIEVQPNEVLANTAYICNGKTLKEL